MSRDAPDPQGFVLALRPALIEAAKLARRLEGTVSNAPKGGETTAVKQALTEADLATQEILLTALAASEPAVRIEAEEDTPTVGVFPRESDDLVIIDPIDGTLHSYLSGKGPYGIMMGLAHRGLYRAGLVALPREGLFFDAASGKGASRTRMGGPPRPVGMSATGDPVLVSHGTPPEVVRVLEQEGLPVRYGCGGAVSVAPLIPGVRAGLRFSSSALGISVRGRIGVLIAREAGACVTQAGGGEFPRDVDTPAKSLLVARSSREAEGLTQLLVQAGLG